MLILESLLHKEEERKQANQLTIASARSTICHFAYNSLARRDTWPQPKGKEDWEVKGTLGTILFLPHDMANCNWLYAKPS